MTFVKTKLLIERMTPGQVAQVRLRGKEPLENVPRSVREHGHSVLGLVPEEATKLQELVYLLTIRKEAV